jgi:hypothetical protein
MIIGTDIEIKGKSGNVILQTGFSNDAARKKELMKENCAILTFNLNSYLEFPKGSYIIYNEEKLYIRTEQKPEEKSLQEYHYELKFEAIEMFFQDFIMFYTRQGMLEAEWTLTSDAASFFKIAIDNIQRFFNDTRWKVGTVQPTEIKTITFNGESIFDALTMIAEAYNAEWHVTDYAINLVSKLEYGSEVVLEKDVHLKEMNRSDGDNSNYCTRLYPFGSTKNLPSNYRNTEEGQVVDGVVQRRLRLPAGIGDHIDAFQNMSNDDVIEGIKFFEEIYPKRVGKITGVRVEERKNEDGTPFIVYFFKDNELNFNTEYILPGLTLMLSFSSGRLNGRDFELAYHNDSKEFEIINQTEGVIVPNASLKPEIGNEYILYNFDIKMVSDIYVPAAEQELLTESKKWLEYNSKDTSVYTCSTNPIQCRNEGLDFEIGQKVSLRSIMFKEGKRSSRITGYEKKLYDKYECTYIIGDSSKYSRLETIEKSISQLEYAEKIYLSSGGNGVYLIKEFDSTQPTDFNTYSSKRLKKEFLSKKTNDTAAGLITFLQGARFGDEEEAKIDALGKAEFENAVIRDGVNSPVFRDGFSGEGFRLWTKDGLASLTLDKLTVRQTMSVFELLINKIRSTGGQIIVSAANGKIKTVEPVDKYYSITFEDENMFVEGDLMRCATFKGGQEYRGYWVEVTARTGNGILILKSEFDSWKSNPEPGDECVLMGNTTNSLRQNLIHISATEDGQPRIDVLNGVHTTNFEDCLRARLGNLDGIYDSWFEDDQPQGDGLYADNVFLKGKFILKSGDDIETKFKVTEGLIQSSVDSVRQEFMEDKGYLNNATFGEGMSKWDTLNEAVFFLANNKWIWLNNSIYSKKGNYAAVRKDDGRTTVFIKNKYISQANANLRSKPDFKTNDKGLKEAVPVYLSFFYRVEKAGTLKVSFENVDKTGFENFDSIEIEKELDVTGGYLQFTGEGLWNGTGDFRLSFTGEIYLYMLILTTDKVEALVHKYKTLFEQSDRLVKISAAVYDKDENMLRETGLVVTDQLSGLYAIDENGSLVSFVGAGQEGVKIKAANISLEGFITANQNFHIDEQGNMWAMDCHISGEINATSGFFKGRIEADEGYFRGKFESNKDGNRVVIDPDGFEKIQLINDMGIPVVGIGFYSRQETTTIGKVQVYERDDNAKLISTTAILPGSLFINCGETNFDISLSSNSVKWIIKNLPTSQPLNTSQLGIDNTGQIWRDSQGYLRMLL